MSVKAEGIAHMNGGRRNGRRRENDRKTEEMAERKRE